MTLDYKNLEDRAIIDRYFNQGGGTPISLTIAYTSTQFSFKWKAPAASSINFHWGDGTTTAVSGNDSTLVTTTSSYAVAGTYTFGLSGDVTDLTYIDISNQAFVSGDISGWSALTNLTYLQAHITGVSGDISGWIALTNLTHLRMNNSYVSGDISGFSALTSITLMYFYTMLGDDITGDVSGWSALTSATDIRINSAVDFDSAPVWSNSSATLYFLNNSMTATQVNNMIESLSTCTSCTINVAGTNAHRTAASNANLNTLLANGNTITLNDVLGAELHTSLNAANDSATEAITAFADYSATIDGGVQVTQGQDISNMLPLGSAESSSTLVNSGSAPFDTFDGASATGFHVVNDTDSAQAGTADEISYVAGKYYIISFSLSLASGALPRYAPRTALGAGDVGGDGFISAVSGSNNHIFRCNTTTTGVVSWDNNASATEFTVSSFSIKEIEVLGSDLVTNGAFTANSDMNTSNCENSVANPYDTFANAAPGGFDAISDGSATMAAGTADEITFVSGQKYVVSFDLVLNSGTAPFLNIHLAIDNTAISDEGFQTSAAGHNVFEFTANTTTTGVLRFWNASTATDYEITNLSVSDSVTDWTNGDGWIVADGLARCDGSQAGYSLLYQAEAKDAGWYLYKVTISNYSAGKLGFRSNDTTYYPNLLTGGGFGANGTFEVLLYNDGSYDYISIAANPSFVGDIDNVSVHKLLVTKEIADSTNYDGDHYVLPEAGSDLDSFIIPSAYTAESIVAQLITGETNATTGFTSYGLDGTGANVFQSQDTTVDTGVWAIEASANDTPTNGARFYTQLNAAPFSISNDDVVRLQATVRHVGSGGEWAIALDNTNLGAGPILSSANIENTDTTFFDIVLYWTHTANHNFLVVSEYNAATDGGIYFDALSIKKVTFV